MGLGAMTGRAAGYCAGYGVPGYANPVGGGGFWRRGGGRGRRHWYRATGQPGWNRAAWGLPAWGYPGWGAAPVAPPYAPSAAGQTEFLQQQADVLEQQLEDIRQRLADLESQEDQQ
jgi:hypothetical protein